MLLAAEVDFEERTREDVEEHARQLLVLFGHVAPNAIVNMNEVFEAFVRARLRRFLAPHCLIVLEKGSDRRLFSANVQIEPDIVVADRSGRVVAVGDVKYKWQWDFVNADVFQMNAYLDTFPESKIAYVFFPSDASYENMATEKLPRERFLAPIPLSPRDMFRDETWELIAINIVKAASARS